ncbi:gastrula zinc finger protein XlCGF28.1-like [Drosophila takahashii]|uniref:gastrula zinc finger protein XlCGF28.1-like n=1 Tax=Drosophila takahashii TaxID=29030 RepID=UPI0038996806
MSPPLYQLNKDPLDMDLHEGEVVIVSDGQVSFSICDYGVLQSAGQVENKAVNDLPENERENPVQEKHSEIGLSSSTVKIDVEEDVGPNELVYNKHAGSPKSPKQLEIHQKAEKRFQCPQCSKAFMFKSQFKYHFLSHSGEKQFKCTHCPKTFSQVGHFNNHLRSHTGEQDDLLEDKGRNEFVDNEPDDDSNNVKESPKSQTPKDLEVHEKREKRFKCSHCPKVFVFKSQLKCHLRGHTGEKPYNCTHCPKTFAFKSQLTYHFRVHSGERPFKCTHCPKTYTQNNHLKIHLQSHSREKPFCCPQCSKSFVSKFTLGKHLLLHTGEKPFKCSFCSKAYPYKAGLTYHLQDHEDMYIAST